MRRLEKFHCCLTRGLLEIASRRAARATVAGAANANAEETLRRSTRFVQGPARAAARILFLWFIAFRLQAWRQHWVPSCDYVTVIRVWWLPAASAPGARANAMLRAPAA